jgi:hypothetical protein
MRKMALVISVLVILAATIPTVLHFMGRAEETATSLEPAASTKPATSPEPSAKIAWEDDFSNTNSGWPRKSLEGREFDYEDGEYYILVKKARRAAAVWNPRVGQLTDFIFEIDARLTSGSNESRYGVIFRRQDNQNKYSFMVLGDGRYLVRKMLNGAWTDLSTGKSVHIKEGNSTNHLKVACEGNQIEVYANGHHLTTVTDNSFAEGCVGIIVGTPEPDGCAAFDNMRVDSLD